MTSGRQILIVDDDSTLLEMLSEQLELHEEFASIGVANGSEALERAKQEYFDVIILDVGLPDIDGREVCKLMRRNGVRSPIIMLTGADTDADTILGLEAGANDYVTKPFRLGVLLARLRTHIRQHEMSEDASFSVGPYIFRPAIKVLQRNDGKKDVNLSEKENAILKQLYRAGDTVVTCEALYADIWDHSAALMTHTPQTHIYRLRQKIEENPSQPRILVSEHGGYRLARS